MSSSDWSLVFDPTEVVDNLSKFFTIVGIWPIESKYRFIYIIYGILFQFIFSFAYTGFNLINLYFVTDLNVITEQIFIVLPMVSMCLRMTNFLFHFKDVTGFLTTIKSFKVLNKEECELYKKRISLFSSVMVLYLSFSTSAVLFSNCAPLFDDEVRLPFPGWYPLNWSNFLSILEVFPINFIFL